MFVKIINSGKETIYDCKRVSFNPIEADSENGITKADVILDVGEQNERTITIECENTNLIYMNNEGKTIDRKVW